MLKMLKTKVLKTLPRAGERARDKEASKISEE